MMRECPQICGGTHLLPYKRKLPRIVERVTAQGSVPWFAWCGSHAHPPIKSNPPIREPTIPNLLALRTTEAEFWGTAIPGTVNVFATQLMVRQIRSTCRVANFFFGTFFFLAKKKVVRSPFTKGLLQKLRRQTKKFDRSPWTKDNFYKWLCWLAMKKQTFSKGLFVIRFFEYEKSYLFHIQKSKKSHENKK